MADRVVPAPRSGQRYLPIEEAKIRAATGLIVAFLYHRQPKLPTAECRTLVVRAAMDALAKDVGCGSLPTSSSDEVEPSDRLSTAMLFRLFLVPTGIDLDNPLRQETLVAVVQRAAADLLEDPPDDGLRS